MSDDFKDLRILIADNNAFLAKTLFTILEAFDAGPIVISSTLEDAEDKINKVKFDCIFVDFMMEKRSGIDFIKKVRTNQNSRNDQSIPIILNTGVTDYDTIIMARDAGITEVISKPFSPVQILQKFENAIKNKREFIDVDEYIGPNRRRRKNNDTEWVGEKDRRVSSVAN